MHGGLDAATDLLRLESPAGTPRCLVLRRYHRATVRRDPEAPARAWQTLQLLQRLDLPAPRPLWFDGCGSLFDRPALLMSWIAGAPVLQPTNVEPWAAELARALAGLHTRSLRGLDTAFLPGPGDRPRRLIGAKTRRLPAHPDAPALVQALTKDRAPLPSTPVLVHGDYWAGNTIWSGEKIAAIVDWDSAAIDDPGLDVGYCRMDLAMLLGGSAPDLFLEAYEQVRGRRVENLWLWDLLGALTALPDPARWLPGYHGLGRSDLTPELIRGRLRMFIADALQRASAESNT